MPKRCAWLSVRARKSSFVTMSSLASFLASLGGQITDDVSDFVHCLCVRFLLVLLLKRTTKYEKRQGGKREESFFSFQSHDPKTFDPLTTIDRVFTTTSCIITHNQLAPGIKSELRVSNPKWRHSQNNTQSNKYFMKLHNSRLPWSVDSFQRKKKSTRVR